MIALQPSVAHCFGDASPRCDPGADQPPKPSTGVILSVIVPQFSNQLRLDHGFASVHIYSMTARDQWTEVLTCPSCTATGSAVLSQARENTRAYHDGDQKISVEQSPSAFRIVVAEFGCEFYCANCGAKAEHSQ